MTTQLANGLSKQSLQAMFHNEVTAISVMDLIAPAECSGVAARTRALTDGSTYRWGDDLSIFGTSIGEAHETEEACQRYLAEADRTDSILRALVFDGFTPIDRLLLQLMAIWEPGLRRPAFDEQVFLSQVLRRWKKGGQANPHIDACETSLLRPFGITRRLGVNLYIDMPEEGGAVEFWNRHFTEAEYAALRQPAPNYGLPRDLLGPADLRIRPRIGEALIFDASRPHAVERLTGQGERITLACFLGVAGEDAPLYPFA